MRYVRVRSRIRSRVRTGERCSRIRYVVGAGASRSLGCGTIRKYDGIAWMWSSAANTKQTIARHGTRIRYIVYTVETGSERRTANRSLAAAPAVKIYVLPTLFSCECQKPNVHERLRDTQSDSYTQAAPAGTRIPRLSQQTSRTSQSYSLLVVAYLLRRISYFDFSCFYFMQKVSEGHLL